MKAEKLTKHQSHSVQVITTLPVLGTCSCCGPLTAVPIGDSVEKPDYAQCLSEL